MENGSESILANTPFFDQPGVKVETLPVGPGVPLGMKTVSNPQVGTGGTYGAWGKSYDNQELVALIEERLSETLQPEDKLSPAELGFVYRHHTPSLSPEENEQLEVEVGARFIKSAAEACGWEPGEVDAVMLGISAPICNDYTQKAARLAGIPDSALKVSVHKACDGSMGALNLALNPNLVESGRWMNSATRNLAHELAGKKVLVGGIEGLSRYLGTSRDLNALQLFGTAAGVIGVIPGKTLKFLAGGTRENYDEDGTLQAHMAYPHSGQRLTGESMLEIYQVDNNHLRFAGLMHEPHDGSSVAMAGLMGMVKLFVRTGVQVVHEVYNAYRERMTQLGTPEKSIKVAIVHHANLKINKLKDKNLQKEGIHLNIPWLLSEFGNVSAASNMIAFLRALPGLTPGDHILMDGFGAGTYYDVLALELGAS